VKAA
jgi:hypothetical protein